jgi:hypothetical protein
VVVSWADEVVVEPTAMLTPPPPGSSVQPANDVATQTPTVNKMARFTCRMLRLAPPRPDYPLAPPVKFHAARCIEGARTSLAPNSLCA